MKFIPKVGEECIFQGNKLVITAVGENSVLAKNPSFVNELALPINEISRPKSPAEIERDEARNKLLEIINGGEGGKWAWVLANKLYDAGYRKQQVKPLSYQSLENMCIAHAPLNMIYKLLEPYTIQGGDK